MNKHKGESSFFVIVSQALIPFSDWKSDEQKGIIIDDFKNRWRALNNDVC